MLISTPAELRELAESRADALDQLIFKDAAEQGSWDGDVLVLEDAKQSLTLFALAQLLETQTQARVFVRSRSFALTQTLLDFSERLASELAERLVVSESLDISTLMNQYDFAGSLALGRLPKSHGALADWARDFSQYQLAYRGTNSVMILGGNTKHMNTTFNETLSRFFTDVKGLRGKGKHRCLLAQNPFKVQRELKQHAVLVGVGGVFSGSKPDAGGQFLADVAEEFLSQKTQQVTVLDFGCGNGSVSYQLLKSPHGERISHLVATDIDADAIRSASANLSDFQEVKVVWDDAASTQKSNSFDLVLLNPPFHDGTRIDLTMVQPLLESSLRVLKPGGVLLLVHNSHARYRPEIESRFSRVQQVGRNKTFTVIRAEKPMK